VIACVAFVDVEAELQRLGFRRWGQTQTHYAYRSNREFVFVQMPNVHGYLPESVVNEAFNAAELPLPDWNRLLGRLARVVSHGKAR
jgi:hypothetical protein